MAQLWLNMSIKVRQIGDGQGKGLPNRQEQCILLHNSNQTDLVQGLLLLSPIEEPRTTRMTFNKLDSSSQVSRATCGNVDEAVKDLFRALISNIAPEDLY